MTSEIAAAAPSDSIASGGAAIGSTLQVVSDGKPGSEEDCEVGPCTFEAEGAERHTPQVLSIPVGEDWVDSLMAEFDICIPLTPGASRTAPSNVAHADGAVVRDSSWVDDFFSEMEQDLGLAMAKGCAANGTLLAASSVGDTSPQMDWYMIGEEVANQILSQDPGIGRAAPSMLAGTTIFCRGRQAFIAFASTVESKASYLKARVRHSKTASASAPAAAGADIDLAIHGAAQDSKDRVPFWQDRSDAVVEDLRLLMEEDVTLEDLSGAARGGGDRGGRSFLGGLGATLSPKNSTRLFRVVVVPRSMLSVELPAPGSGSPRSMWLMAETLKNQANFINWLFMTYVLGSSCHSTGPACVEHGEHVSQQALEDDGDEGLEDIDLSDAGVQIHFSAAKREAEEDAYSVRSYTPRSTFSSYSAGSGQPMRKGLMDFEDRMAALEAATAARSEELWRAMRHKAKELHTSIWEKKAASNRAAMSQAAPCVAAISQDEGAGDISSSEVSFRSSASGGSSRSNAGAAHLKMRLFGGNLLKSRQKLAFSVRRVFSGATSTRAGSESDDGDDLFSIGSDCLSDPDFDFEGASDEPDAMASLDAVLH